MINSLHEDNNVAEAIASFGGDAKFQEFVGSIGGGVPNFVNAVIGGQKGKSTS